MLDLTASTRDVIALVLGNLCSAEATKRNPVVCRHRWINLSTALEETPKLGSAYGCAECAARCETTPAVHA